MLEQLQSQLTARSSYHHQSWESKREEAIRTLEFMGGPHVTHSSPLNRDDMSGAGNAKRTQRLPKPGGVQKLENKTEIPSLPSAFQPPFCASTREPNRREMSREPGKCSSQNPSPSFTEQIIENWLWTMQIINPQLYNNY